MYVQYALQKRIAQKVEQVETCLHLMLPWVCQVHHMNLQKHLREDYEDSEDSLRRRHEFLWRVEKHRKQQEEEEKAKEAKANREREQQKRQEMEAAAGVKTRIEDLIRKQREEEELGGSDKEQVKEKKAEGNSGEPTGSAPSRWLRDCPDEGKQSDEATLSNLLSNIGITEIEKPGSEENPQGQQLLKEKADLPEGDYLPDANSYAANAGSTLCASCPTGTDSASDAKICSEIEYMRAVWRAVESQDCNQTCASVKRKSTRHLSDHHNTSLWTYVKRSYETKEPGKPSDTKETGRRRFGNKSGTKESANDTVQQDAQVAKEARLRAAFGQLTNVSPIGWMADRSNDGRQYEKMAYYPASGKEEDEYDDFGYNRWNPGGIADTDEAYAPFCPCP